MSQTVLLTLLGCLVWQVVATPLDNPGSQGTRYFHAMDSSHCQSPKVVKVLIQPDGVRVKLELVESSRDFLSSNFLMDRHVTTRPCYYQGIVVDGTNANMAIAKVSRGMLSATFNYNGKTFDVPSQSDASPELTASQLESSTSSGRCGTQDHLAADAHRVAPPVMDGHARLKRSLPALDTNSVVARKDRKYILLLLTGDSAFYEGLNRSVEAVTARLWDIGNYVNGIYKQIGVNVVTVKTDVFTTDPYPLVKSDVDSMVNDTALMYSYLNYSIFAYKDVQYTSAHLVTGYNMSNGAIGLALIGSLCQFPGSGGINTDKHMNQSAYEVATVVAHELGHNMGLVHDTLGNTTCECPDAQGCIMHVSVSFAPPVRFSDCSVSTYNEYSVQNGIGYCISRPPSDTQISATLSTCGNRIVEAGEECDCGLPSICNNTCCNPYTCKLTTGAKCASGQCCDTTTCSLISAGTQCREARGVCDLPEFCDGSSEWCPKFDDHVIDGTACAVNPEKRSEVLAFCYQGDCTSRDSRCSALVKASRRHVEVENATMAGSPLGYCSYTYNGLSYDYKGCSEQNKRCGTLYCKLPSNEPPVSNWKSVHNAQFILLPESMAKSTCLVQVNLRNTGYRDPGMVPNGAECGADRMCVNSECQTLSSVMSTTGSSSAALPNCNGHGRLTQSRQCFCDAGFAPPDCVGVGGGGSVSNQPRRVDQSGVDRFGFLGIGIAVGLVAAVLIAAAVGVTIWALRRRDEAASVTGTAVGNTTMVDGSLQEASKHQQQQQQDRFTGFANPISHGQVVLTSRRSYV